MKSGTDKKTKIGSITAAVVAVAAVAASIWVMASGKGLQEGLDFGAGAYYYADIPEFEKYLAWDAFSEALPYWVYVLLFLIWGFMIYKVWVWIDKRGK